MLAYCSRSLDRIEWIEYYAKDTPAPGDYGAPALPKPGGGVFSEARPKTDVEWAISRAARIPGPGQYGAPKLPGPGGGQVLGALHGEPSSSSVARAENSPMMIGRPDRLYMD